MANARHDEDGGPAAYTAPGIDLTEAGEVVQVLQDRLRSLVDLTLTLKHIHWNVVGPTFIAVHEMLDPQYDRAAAMVDAVAERIATLGGQPDGRAGSLVRDRRWGDYPLGRAQVPVHLRELDRVYAGVIADHRRAFEQLHDADPVSEDLLIGQTGDLELSQWFVRAHLESTDGSLQRGSSMDASGPAPADERTSAAR
jgi:starvation-inducible DNA-binding protein